jgi:hypothetical protein
MAHVRVATGIVHFCIAHTMLFEARWLAGKASAVQAKGRFQLIAHALLCVHLILVLHPVLDGLRGQLLLEDPSRNGHW